MVPLEYGRLQKVCFFKYIYKEKFGIKFRVVFGRFRRIHRNDMFFYSTNPISDSTVGVEKCKYMQLCFERELSLY